MQILLRGKDRYETGPRKASRAHSKAHNLRMLVQTIAENEQISRADLARVTGLTRASVSTLIAELIEDRWVVEAGQISSAVGKRPTMLELDGDSRDVIVVDLSARPIVGTIVDITGQARCEAAVQHSSGEEGTAGPAVIDALTELLTELLQRSDRHLLGIGISCPGVIDHDGRVIESEPLDWHDVDLKTHVHNVCRSAAGGGETEATQPRVQIINDSQAVALAVHRRQSNDEDASVDDLVAIRLSTGIGAGIVLNGQIHLGLHRAAGEIAPLVKALMGRPLTSPLELDQADAVRLSPELGSAIGSAAGHLANVFDVPRVYLATAPGAAGDRFQQAATAAANDAVLSSLRTILRVETVEDDGLALKGAAAYLLQTETGLTTG